MRGCSVLLMLGCALSLMVAGCDDDNKANNDIDSGTDGGDEGESVDFAVVAWSSIEEIWVPIEGATVAFDAPGGERAEAVTGSDGMVTFDGIDWSLGVAAATAHAPGYILSSLVDIDSGNMSSAFSVDGALALTTVPTTTELPETTTVGGDVTGLVDAGANNICLFPFSGYSEYYSGSGTAPYHFKVERNLPFTLVGIEFVEGYLESGTGYFVDISRAMILDHEGFSESSAVLDLDFAACEADLLRAEGSIGLPEREDSPLRNGWANVWVHDWNSASGNTGWAETIDFNEDGTAFDVDYVWVEPAQLEEPHTFYQVWDYDHDCGSINFKPGYPEAGELSPPMLDTPAWITPENIGVYHPLHDTLEWELFDDAATWVELDVVRDEELVWMVVGAPSATSIKVPEPPSTVDEGEYLGTDLLGGDLLTGVPDMENNRWERVSIATTIFIDPS